MDKPDIQKLLEIMARLRSPDGGCPWDLDQTFATIAPYTIEEAYEVAEAISNEDMPGLADELGDLLLQVVYHAQMAQEAGHFDFGTVVESICAKMIRRHPHVFGDETIADARAQSLAWDTIKATEAGGSSDHGVLSGVPVALPALTRAAKLGRRAARVGIDWADFNGVRAKVDEELAELDAAIARGAPEPITEEMGDVFCALVNACRHLDVDPETSVRGANRRFQARFAHVEKAVAESGRDWGSWTLDELEVRLGAAKRAVG